MVLTSVLGNLGLAAVARQMRRQLGPGDSAALRDVLAAPDAGATSNENDDFAAWVPHRNAKKKD